MAKKYSEMQLKALGFYRAYLKLANTKPEVSLSSSWLITLCSAPEIDTKEAGTRCYGQAQEHSSHQFQIYRVRTESRKQQAPNAQICQYFQCNSLVKFKSEQIVL